MKHLFYVAAHSYLSFLKRNRIDSNEDNKSGLFSSILFNETPFDLAAASQTILVLFSLFLLKTGKIGKYQTLFEDTNSFLFILDVF